jgi:hypothetical protein
VFRLLRRLIRTRATSRGLFGGSRGWLTVWALLTGKKFVGKYIGKDAQVVSLERLKPGESMTLSAIPTPTRKERKAAVRSAKESEAIAKAAASSAKAAHKAAKKAARKGRLPE